MKRRSDKTPQELLNELLNLLQNKDSRADFAEAEAKSSWVYKDPAGDVIMRPEAGEMTTGGWPRYVINDQHMEAMSRLETHINQAKKIGTPILVRAHQCNCDSVTGVVMTQCPFCLIDGLVPQELSIARRKGHAPETVCPLTDEDDKHPLTADGRLIKVQGLRLSALVDALHRGVWHLLMNSAEVGDARSIAALTLLRSLLVPLESVAWTMQGTDRFASLGAHRIFFETVQRGGDYHDALIQLRENDSRDGWQYEHHLVYRGPKDSKNLADTEILSLMLQHSGNEGAKADPVPDAAVNFLRSSPSGLMLAENATINQRKTEGVTADEMALKVLAQMRRLHVGGPKGMDDHFVSPFKDFVKLHARLQYGQSEGAERQPSDLFDSIDFAMERLTSN